MTAARIVVGGGGFAGTNLVKALKGKLPPGASLTLVSDESYTCFSPMLPEVVGASIFPEQVVAPIREILRPDATHRFVMGRVSRIDTAARWLQCESLAGSYRIAYDELVLAVGNRARLDLIPGMQQHALPLKTMGDAMEIRNRVLRRVAQIELEANPKKRVALGSFLVIGGGFSGVEVAGELADCIRSLKRHYPAGELLLPNTRHDGQHRTAARCRPGVRSAPGRTAGVAALACLLPVADADPRTQGSHLRRVDLGHVLPQRHHPPALHAQPRAGPRLIALSPAQPARRQPD